LRCQGVFFSVSGSLDSQAPPTSAAGQPGGPAAPLGLSGHVRCWTSSSVPPSPCRQFRARATRPRTTSGGSPGVLAMCHSVGSSYSAPPRPGDPTSGPSTPAPPGCGRPPWGAPPWESPRAEPWGPAEPVLDHAEGAGRNMLAVLEL